MKVKSHAIYMALSSETRREILTLLRQRAMLAGELADHVAVSKPTLSGHLNILKQAELITAERQGARLLYRINLSVAEEALVGLAELLELVHLLHKNTPQNGA